MTATRWWVLVALASGAFLLTLGFLAICSARGIYLAQVSWLVSVVLVILAVVVFVGGLTLRAYQAGRRPSLPGTRAAQLVMLAKAAAISGAMLAGWYGAQAALTVPSLMVEAQQSRLLTAGAATVAAVALAIAGLIAERWGRLPPPSDEESTIARMRAERMPGEQAH